MADRVAGAQRPDDRPAKGARPPGDDNVTACKINHIDDLLFSGSSRSRAPSPDFGSPGFAL